MKRLLILIFLLSTFWSYAQKDPGILTKEQWKEDILFLKEEIEKNHIDPFHFQNKQEWDKAFGDLIGALPDLSWQQIIARIISLAASVGDGHTNARPYAALTRYPVSFQWFGEDLRIIRIAKEDSQVLGAKVLKVDGMKVEDAHNRLKSLIPGHESPTFVLGWSEYLFSLDEILIGTGIKKTGPLKLQLQLVDGKEKTISLPLPEKNHPVEKVWAYNPLPLYLSAPERSPYYEWIPKADKVLYFNFERYPEWDEMRSFGMGLIHFIQENEVKKLIVDLRENGGGDFKKGLKLIEELQKTYLNAPGKVFVIIGRNTFSAGMSNAAHFKTMLQATLVGETTGARPVGYQENFSFTLPHSNIPASCAVKRYAFLDEDTDGIIPDKEILPDFELYKSGGDPVIQWIIEK